MQTGGDEALTLLFVRPLQIYYLKSSDDPVFPADGIKRFPGGDVWHVKSDPKARVLACTDKTELCDPTGDKCWPITHRPDIIRDDRGYWLMKLSLKDSTIYNSISLRLGTALVAQEMISQQNSLELPKGHWMVEAQRLFATSLALAQIKAWSISSGEDRAHEADFGWENQTPDEAEDSGGLCDLLKFRSVGYTDIDLQAFLLLLLLPYGLTAVLGTRWQTCSSIANRARALVFGEQQRNPRQPEGPGDNETESSEASGSQIPRSQSGMASGSKSVGKQTACLRSANGPDDAAESTAENHHSEPEASNSTSVREQTAGGSAATSSPPVAHEIGTGNQIEDEDAALESRDDRLVLECIAQALGSVARGILDVVIWIGHRVEKTRG